VVRRRKRGGWTGTWGDWWQFEKSRKADTWASSRYSKNNTSLLTGGGKRKSKRSEGKVGGKKRPQAVETAGKSP